jgi:alpha-1,3-rhamnosyl/mannosyltransferase
VSEYSRGDLVKYLGIAPAAITVTPLGATPLADNHGAQLPGGTIHPPPYILYVGVLENVKNADRLVEAYAALAPDLRQQFPLYLVGRKANAYPRLRQLIEQHGIGDRVRVLGYVSDTELSQLYAGAIVFAYPSDYEGFGLPILEAMRYGLPILAANKTSLPEVAGDAALLVDTQVESIERGLDTLLRDAGLRQKLATKARARVSEFRWENTARATEQVYDRVLESAGKLRR